MGIIKDLSPEQIPDGGWQDGQNVRFIDGRVLALFGHSRFFDTAVEVGALQRIMHGDQFLKQDSSVFLVLQTLDNTYYWNTAINAFVKIQDASVFTGSVDNFFMTDTAYNLFIICNGVDVARKWAGTGGNIATLGGLSVAAPLGGGVIPKLIRRMPGFLVAMNNIEDGGVVPYRVRWARFGQAEVWTNDINGNGQAGYNDLDDTPYGINNGFQINNAMAIYKQDGIYLMVYVGPPTIFNFRKIVTSRGLLAPRAIVPMGSVHFFLSDDNFYMFDGANIQALADDKVRDFFFNDLNPKYSGRVQAILFKQYGEVWWFYPSLSSSGDFDKVLIFNYRLRTWTFAKFPLAAPMSCAFLYTLQSDVQWITQPDLSWTDVPGVWNNVLLLSQSPLMMMGNASSIVFQHGLVYNQDSGSYTKQAITKPYDFKRPGIYKRLQLLQLSTDPTTLANIKAYVGVSNNPGDTPTWMGPYSIQTGFGSPRILLDISAVYFSFRFESTGVNDPWDIRGITPWFLGDGEMQ